ncbi:hypothetical protein D0A37_26890 [Microcoleus vaginatus HSN003]|nr:hypothetical protein D0A37_26890 [Microcoleus vaginatus HSN003]
MEKGLPITFVQTRIKHGSGRFLVGFRLDQQHLARDSQEISNKEILTGSQEEPENPFLESLPRERKIGGRAFGFALPGSSWEQVSKSLKKSLLKH